MTTVDDDFDPRKEIVTLSDNINQPHKFAEIFCNAARNVKSIDNVLKEINKDLFKNDHETIEIIKNIVRQVDKEDWRFWLKKIGAAGWAVIWVVVGSIITLS